MVEHQFSKLMAGVRFSYPAPKIHSPPSPALVIIEAMDNIMNRAQSDVCSHCGGAAPGWKCPACGYEPERFDPMHWRECPGRGKVQAKCEKCGQAESKCTCPAQN